MYLLRIKPAVNGNPLFSLEFFQDKFPPYAILSHRWGSASDEVTFQELKSGDLAARSKKGYAKILACCVRSLDYGLEYAWIDTCCIDKSSSAELSEAINSMYAWYEASTICFAYLDDVPMAGPADLYAIDSPFRKSAWFTRGWTLQELIAPSEVYFISQTWSRSPLGYKTTMAPLLEEITGVKDGILRDRDKLHDASIGERMSWASRRVTTRIEDEAYALMGIFGVCMPAIYGEGRKAFYRLQDEIMRTNPDHTIFAWSMPPNMTCPDDIGMLASSPRMFQDFISHRVVDYKTFVNAFPHSTRRMKPDYSITNFGLHIHLPLMKMDGHFEGYYLAFLACSPLPQSETRPLRFVAVILRPRTDRPDGHFYRTRLGSISLPCFTMSKKQADNMDSMMLWISVGASGMPRSRIGAKLSSRKTTSGTITCVYPTDPRVLPIFQPHHAAEQRPTLIKPLHPTQDQHLRLLRDPDHGFMTLMHGMYDVKGSHMHCLFEFHPDRYAVLSIPPSLYPGQQTHTLVAIGVRDGRLWMAQEPASSAFVFAATYSRSEYSRFDCYNGDSVWYTAPHLVQIAAPQITGFEDPRAEVTVGKVSMVIEIRLSMS